MTGHHQHDPDMIMDQGFWDERYRSSPALWSGRPNPQLVAEAAGLTPGTALDVGCGEGADAIWLAERGWQVSAVDISPVALERAAAHAAGAEIAARITWRRADLLDDAPGAAAFDLVSAQFMQLPRDQRDALFPQLAAAVAPGGTLLIVGHHPADLHTTAARPPMPELFFTAEDLAAGFDPAQWDVLVSEARARPTVDPEGNTVTVQDAVLHARKRV